MKSILEVLETTVKNYPTKIAFVQKDREIDYQTFLDISKKIGTSLTSLNERNKPIIIFIDKTINALASMFGVLYSGNFYTMVDVNMPADRIDMILKTLEPIAIVTDNKNLEKAKGISNNVPVLIHEELVDTKIDEDKLANVYEKLIDTDPMYVLFTSGSTGVPKGSVISHKALLAYSDWFTKTFDINENTIFGSQTPFYFSMSISDIFGTIRSGATFHIIPKMLFSFPVKLLEYLNESKINTIYWVPSALAIVANLKALDVVLPTTLENILFAGEVMPTKQLNIWRKHLPNVKYANLFGPTETTDICTYYVVNREFDDVETLPIGAHCDNCDVFIVKDDGSEALDGEEGELYARGSFVGLGYYNNPEKTNAAFVQNPLNKAYPELVYKTGDIVKYNELGELIYLSRRDFQIKHMGYRIELGEIEMNINALDGITTCACIYVDDKIILYFVSNELKEEDVITYAKDKLLAYMVPNVVNKITKMPHNANGKIDRVELKKMYEGDK